MGIEGTPDKTNTAHEKLQVRNKMQTDLVSRRPSGDSLQEDMMRFVTEGYAAKFGEIVKQHPEILDQYLLDPNRTLADIEEKLFH